MSTLSSIFNPQGAQPEQARATELYKPSYKDGIGGIYKAIIRFVPNPKDAAKCVITKNVAWVLNPTSQKGMYVDDPSSIGQQSPIKDMFFRLYNSKVDAFINFAKKHLSSRTQYASLVQIIQDPQHPELNGKIMVFVYGKVLHDKLYAEEHPMVGAGTNPFHPITGRYFSLICTQKSNFNDFNQSSFVDNKDANGTVLPSGIWYKNPTTGAIEYVTEHTPEQDVLNYLIAESPDLSAYDYKPWSTDIEQHVSDTLQIITNYVNTGTLQTPAQQAVQNAQQVLNTPTMTVNSNPVFPGISIGGSSPVPQSAPAYQPIATMPNPAPAAMPNPTIMPTMASNTPSIGLSTPGISVSPVTPNISGIEMPNVTPAMSAPAVGMNTPSIGDINSLIADL